MLGPSANTTLYSKMLVLFIVASAGLAACSSHPQWDLENAGSVPPSAVPTPSSADASSSGSSSSTAAAELIAVPTGDKSVGCGVEPEIVGLTDEVPGDVPLVFEMPNGERTYRLGVPETYDENVPAQLILNLHGAGSNALLSGAYSRLPEQAAEAGSITVSADAIEGNWELAAGGYDNEFLVGLVLDVTTRYCVNLNDIHVIGMSLGAWKATTVGCAYPDVFASMALITEEVRLAGCAPMPVIAFHGTADEIVPYGEGSDPGVTVEGTNANLPGARNNIANWAEGGNCSTQHDTEFIGDDIELWTYPDCDPGVDVHFYTVKGGGHTWPGSELILSPTTSTIDATELALEFFGSHPNPNR